MIVAPAWTPPIVRWARAVLRGQAHRERPRSMDGDVNSLLSWSGRRETPRGSGSELVASPSFATDLGRELPMEHSIRRARLSLRLADLIGAGDELHRSRFRELQGRAHRVLRIALEICGRAREPIEVTRAWVAVRAPAAKAGRLARPAAIEVVVGHLAHPLRGERHPVQTHPFGRPALAEGVATKAHPTSARRASRRSGSSPVLRPSMGASGGVTGKFVRGHWRG